MIQKLNLNQLKEFSLCPAYFWFNINNRPIKNARHEVILKTIQKVYLKQSENKTIIPWKKVLEWINKEIFKIVDLTAPNSYERIKKVTESIVLPVNHWYFEIFKKENCVGYINVPLTQSFNGIQIIDKAPIIKTGNKITIVTLSEINHSDVRIYNDFISRGMVYLLSKELKNDKINLEHYGIGNEGKFTQVTLRGNKQLNQKMEKVLDSLTASIRLNIKYPSFTSECNSCKFQEKCVL